MRKRKGKTKKKARSDTSTKAKRVYKKKTKRANAAPKTRAGNTLTESEFWQMIRSSLRNRTRFWGPKLEALKRARRPSQSSNRRLKWEFCCSKCGVWHPQKNVEVHHLEPAGTLRSSDDLKDFVDKLFCEVDKLSVICKPCHKLEHIKK
jgi:hypothetical protein